MKIKFWHADFKDAALRQPPLNRQKWDAHRDLVVIVPAPDQETARDAAFLLAQQKLRRPWLGGLSEHPVGPVEQPVEQ